MPSANDFAPAGLDFQLNESFDSGWPDTTQQQIPESSSDFGSPSLQLDEDFAGWSQTTQQQIPESSSDFGSPDHTLDDDMDWSAPANTQTQGTAEMYLHLKNVSAGSVIIADLGLELAPGAEMIAASSSPEDDSDLYPFSSAEIRKSKSLDYVISANQDLKFKWDAADSFEYDSAQSADKKWNPQKLQLADLQTESLEVGSLEAISSVSANSVSADTVSLDGEDLGDKLTGLDSTDVALSAATAAEATRAAAAEAANSAATAAEATRAASAEGLLDGRLDTVEGSGAGSIAKAVADESAALKAGEIATAQAAADAAAAAAANAQAEVDQAEISAAQLAARVTGEENLSATQNSRLDALEASDSSTGLVITGIQTSATATAQSAANNATNHATLVTSAGNTQSALTAEISARSSADVAATNDRAAVRNEFAAADTAILSSISSNDADILALQNSLADVISNTDPSALDSLTEVVAKFVELDQEDSDLSGAITAALGTHTSELSQEVSDREAGDLAEKARAEAAEAILTAAAAAADAKAVAAQGEIDALEIIHADDKALATASRDANAAAILAAGVDRDQNEADADAAFASAATARGNIQSAVTANESASLAARNAIIADLATEEAARIADVNAEQSRSEAAEAVNAASAAQAAQDAADEEVRALAAEAVIVASVSAEEGARIAAVSAEASTRASAIAALRIETFHHMGSESGYCSSMYLKSGDMPSNMNSPRFTAPSACDEYSVSFSEDLPGACDVEIKLVGSDGSIKATETVSCAQGESYKSGSMSMAPVAGDRLSFKVSSGVCKDPVVSVSCSKNP